MSVKLNKIKEVQGMIKQLKDKNYKICNKELQEKEEFKKFLYINLLCTVIQYDNEASKNQISFLNRLIFGANCEEKIEVYMRKSLDTDSQIIEDFVEEYKDSTLRYNFALEGIILINLADSSEVNYKYLVDLIEILGITKLEVNYLSALAKSILMQSSEIYKEAMEIIEDGIDGFDFTPYTKNYLSGVIKNTFKEYYACGINREELDISNIYFNNKKVIFKNLKLRYTEGLFFNGCESVEFINCDISNTYIAISFTGVGKIEFNRCDIYKNYNRFANLDSCGSLFINNSEFNEIRYTIEPMFVDNLDYHRNGSKMTYARSYFPSGAKITHDHNGSSYVYFTTMGSFIKRYIYISSAAAFKFFGNSINNIVIENTNVSNIYLGNYIDTDGKREEVVGVFIQANRQPIGNLSIKNCKFSGCIAKGYKGDLKDESVIYCQTPDNYTCENTTVEGGVRFITKFYE